MSARIKQFFFPYLWITVASALYALGFCWCYDPNQIGFGGITGVGQILNHFFPILPIGTVVILLNIPLFLLGWRLLGGHLLISSLYAMFVSSAFIDLINLFYTFEPMDPLLACIFGGVLMGGSLGVVFLQGATTGGTDLAARLLKLVFKWLPMGKLLLAVDLIVVVSVALAFQTINTALYGLVALYISTLALDGVLYGMDTAKVAYIISDHNEEIRRTLVEDLDKGVTILHGQGAYTGAEKQVLLCAFKQREIATIKSAVKGLDPNAFLIVCDAHEVLGEGFRVYHSDGL